MSSTRSARKVTAIITAAGSGTRLKAGVPKAFVSLGGTTLLERAIRSMITAEVVDRIVVTVSASMEDYARTLLTKQGLSGSPLSPRLVVGGIERVDSVRNALDTIDDDGGVVLVHDSARALTPPGMIARVVGAVLDGNPAVIPVVPVADTIKVVDDDHVVSTPPRERLRAVQTPQGFDVSVLKRCNEAYFRLSHHDTIATDDASLAELSGVAVKTVAGDPMAFKITTPFDLILARQITQAIEPTIFEVPGDK